MGKLLLLLSFVATAMLGIGTAVAPDNLVFWLASGANTYQYLRVILVVLLVVQLMTNPPRRLWFRVLAGTVAAGIGAWAIPQTYVNHMQLLDSLVFISSSLAVFVTALESKASLSTIDTLASSTKTSHPAV